MVGVCDVCGRALMQRVDDRRDTIQERLLVYGTSTRPVVDFYAGRGSLRHVNGDDAELKVRESLLTALEVHWPFRHRCLGCVVRHGFERSLWYTGGLVVAGMAVHALETISD